MGLANPAWLLGIGLLAPLAWLYLRVQPRPPATVSSLRLWRLVPSPPTPPRRRPRLPPVFFAQAALIVASSVALAGPYHEEARPPGPPRDAVLVVDISASMQSRQDGATRFEAARTAAHERVDELGAQGRRFALVRAAPQPEVVETGLDAEEAHRALSELSPSDTTANLTAAVELAASLAGPGGSIDVFSDTTAEAIVMSRDARRATTVHAFGRGGENVAITDLRVQARSFAGETGARILATVRNFSDRPRDVTFQIVPLDAAAAPSARDDAAANPPATESDTPAPAEDGATSADVESTSLVRPLQLDARAAETLAIEGVDWAGTFEARLTPGDDLALDDVIWGYVPGARAIDVLLVTDDAALRDRFAWLAERAGSFRVRPVAPRDYTAGEAADITIFDRFVPKLPPSSNVAYLAPTTGNADVTVVRLSEAPRIAERRAHPLLRGIARASTLLDGSPSALAPGGLRPVLDGRSEGRAVELLQSGTVGGRQIVAAAFRIDSESLARADDLPTLLFTLNLLSQLSPPSRDAPEFRTTGERLRAGSRWTTPIETLQGPDVERNLAPGADLTLERAGRYLARSRDVDRRLFVNFIDPAESDIHRAEEGGATADGTSAEAAEGETTADGSTFDEVPYLPEMLALLLFLLLVEWLVVALTPAVERRTPARGATR